MQGKKDLYEAFVKNHPSGTFFQSWAFGEFQEKIPYRGKTFTLVVKNPTSCKLQAASLVIKMKLRFGKCWLWIPYGPLGFSEEIFEDLARIAKEERAVFARIEPASVIASAAQQFRLDCCVVPRPPRNYKIIPSSQRYTPEHTLVLDLEKSEEEILAQMKPKGRYNIATALRHGVLVEQFMPGHNQQHFDDFYQLLKNTAGRDGFGIHPKFFYQTLLETLAPKNMASLFLAYKNPRAGGNDKEVIGGIIVIFYKDTTTYYYGASSYEHRNLMAPYLLQWEAIREAKRRGMKTYDFLGIAPPSEKDHSWTGVTEFKKKFGGREISCPPAFDVVYQPLLYRAMRLVQSCRR